MSLLMNQFLRYTNPKFKMLHCRNQDLPVVAENLTYVKKNALIWFRITSIKANPKNLQLIILSKNRHPKYNALII